MPHTFRVGIPELDAVIASEAVQSGIARQIRYGQSRLLEAIMALLMLAIGSGLFARGNTFSLPSFRVIHAFVDEDQAAWIAVTVALMRLWALWMNGRQHMPALRALGCFGGMSFWTFWGIGLYATYPPLVPMAPAAVVFVIAETASFHRTIKDAYASNTFGLARWLKRRGTVNNGGA